MSDPNTTLQEHAMDNTLDIQSGRHPVNTGHLVMGLVFAGLVGIWALVIGDVVTGDDIRWLLPIPWVAGGAIGLAAATAANMRSRRTASSVDSAFTAGTDRPDEPIWSPATDDTDTTRSSPTDGTDPIDDTRRLPDDTDPTEEIR